MTRLVSRLEKAIRRQLAATGLEWGCEVGASHIKIVLAGRLVATLSKGRCHNNDERFIAAAIRRRIAEMSSVPPP